MEGDLRIGESGSLQPASAWRSTSAMSAMIGWCIVLFDRNRKVRSTDTEEHRPSAVRGGAWASAITDAIALPSTIARQRFIFASICLCRQGTYRLRRGTLISLVEQPLTSG